MTIWVLLGAVLILFLIWLGYLIGAHRYPASSPKFEVERVVVEAAYKALKAKQSRQNQHELEKLCLSFGYDKDWRP